MLKHFAVYSIMFTMITGQAALAAETARGGAQRSPAQVADEAIGSIDIDAQKDQLANMGRSLEAVGITFGTVPAAGGASEGTHIADLLSHGQSSFRMNVPAHAGVGAYGLEVRVTGVDSGGSRASIAAYNADFSRRLGMRSVEFRAGDSSDDVRLNFERAAQALARDARRGVGHTSVMQKVYDALVPSAQAKSSAGLFIFHSICFLAHTAAAGYFLVRLFGPNESRDIMGRPFSTFFLIINVGFAGLRYADMMRDLRTAD